MTAAAETPQTPAAETARKLVDSVREGLERAVEMDRLFDNYTGNKHDPVSAFDEAKKALTQLTAYIADLERENGKLKAFAEWVRDNAESAEFGGYEISEQARLRLEELAEEKTNNGHA